MTDEEVMHVIGVLFLLSQNPLHQNACRRVLVRKIPDHVAIRFDGDALSDQIFLDHFNQVIPFDVFGSRASRDTIGVQVWFTAELIDPLREKVEVLFLLFGMLGEFFFDRFTGETSCANGVEFITENTNDLRRDSMVEYCDAVVNLSLIVRRDGTFIQMLPSSAPDLLHVGEKSSRTQCLPLSFVMINNSLHVHSSLHHRLFVNRAAARTQVLANTANGHANVISGNRNVISVLIRRYSRRGMKAIRTITGLSQCQLPRSGPVENFGC